MSDDERQQDQGAQAEPTGNRWGDPISAERQAELMVYLDRWVGGDYQHPQDPDESMGPFEVEPGTTRVRLSGADVFWLAAHTIRTLDELAPTMHLRGPTSTGRT